MCHCWLYLLWRLSLLLHKELLKHRHWIGNGCYRQLCCLRGCLSSLWWLLLGCLRCTLLLLLVLTLLLELMLPQVELIQCGRSCSRLILTLLALWLGCRRRLLLLLKLGCHLAQLYQKVLEGIGILVGGRVGLSPLFLKGLQFLVSKYYDDLHQRSHGNGICGISRGLIQVHLSQLNDMLECTSHGLFRSR